VVETSSREQRAEIRSDQRVERTMSSSVATVTNARASSFAPCAGEILVVPFRIPQGDARRKADRFEM